MNLYPQQLRAVAALCDTMNAQQQDSDATVTRIDVWCEETLLGAVRDDLGDGHSWSFTPAVRQPSA
jgi:hypothetical protein